MGDVARIQKEWTNTEVGVGYAAPFVHRQKGLVPSEPVKIIDMTKRQEDEEREEIIKKKKSKRNREKTTNVNDGRCNFTEGDNFNPFLQELAGRLSNKTRAFTFANE